MFPSQYPEVAPYRHLRRLLEAQVDMLFGDLRTMLCLPGEAEGLDAGCNLTAAVLAVNIAAGASVLFWDSSVEELEKRGNRKRRFGELMGAMYPWSDDDAVDAELGAKLLYDYARSPLTHTLGIGKTRRLFPGIPADEREVWLSKPQRGLDAAVVDDVLSNRERPVWLDPTIRSGPDGYTVYVVTLAWVCTGCSATSSRTRSKRRVPRPPPGLYSDCRRPVIGRPEPRGPTGGGRCRAWPPVAQTG